MSKQLLALREKVLIKILDMEYEQAQISNYILIILQVQNSLINLCYLPFTNFKYLKLVIFLCRPQALISFPDTSIISIGLIILYWIYLFFQIKFKNRQIALLRVMLDTILLNFFIETSYDQQYYVVVTLIIITQTIHSFIQEGILDFKTCNLQQPKQLLINKFIRLFSILQIVLNINRDVQIIISALNSGLIISKILIYRHKNRLVERICLCSNVITLYYVLLIYLDFNPGGYSAHIIIIPFLSKVCIQVLNNKNYDQKNIHINDLFILYSQFHNLQEYKFINPKFDVDELMQSLKPKQLNDDAVLYASLLLLQDKKLESLRYLQFIQSSKKISLSRVNTLKMNRLYQKSTQQLYNLIDFQEANMADSIKQLLQSEELSEQIKSKLVQEYIYKILLIRQKIDFLMELQQQRIKKTKLIKLTNSLLEYKIFLQDQCIQYGGEKQKSVYCFYLCELLNDYISANEINSVLAVNDDRQNKLLLGQQYLSNKMIYLIIEYNNDLDIIKCSNNIQLLNLQQNLVINKSINILIPQTIQQYHSQLIQQFFVNGTSKYLRKLNNNIYLDQQQNITQVDFGLDIIYQSNNIQFIVFMQQLLNQQYMFLVNQQQFITNVSLNLQQLLQQYQFEILNKNINQFIPNFDNYLNNEEFINIDNIELIRLKLTVNMQVYIKQINNQPIYFIVYVDTVKTLYKTNTSIQQTVSDRQSVDEDIIIFKPMDMEQNNFEEDKDLSKAIIEMDNTINAQRIFSPKQSFQIPFIENESKFFESKKQQEESLQHQKQDFYVENVQDFNDAASQMSSLQGVRRSKYYKKYELVQKSSELNAFSSYHKQFLMMFIVGMLIQLILQLIQLLSINTNFTKLVSAVDLLQIKNYIYQPLATFLVTRWSIFNYNGYYNTKQITYENWQSLLVFPYSNLDLGFDDLATNIHMVLNRPELQQFLEFTQVDLQIYIYTSTGDNFTLSVRNAIDLLLNYQYVVKMRYIIEGTVVTDSPYIYFTYKNYIPMNEVFTTLNQQVYQDAINNTYNLQNLTLTFLIIIICFLVFFILLSLFYCIKIEGCIYNYLHIVRNIDKVHVDNEIIRLQNLHEQIQKDPTILYNFIFNFEQREQMIEQDKDDESFKRSKRKQKDQGIQFGYYMIWLLLVLLFILLGTLLTFLLSNSFLNLFPNTIYLYMKFSEVGTDIPTMFAMREVLYGRTLFPYYSADDLKWILNQVKDCVNTTQQFNKINYDKNNLIMSDSFYNHLAEINDNNLCNYLDKNMTIKSKDICPLIMNGNMARGLRSLLIYMANFIQTDMQVNNLTSRSIAPYLELEAAFLVSMVIKGINQKFNSDLYQQTVTLLNTLIIVSTAFIIFIILLIFGVATKYRYFIIKQYYLYQRSIYLMPRNTIFLDDVYERNLRSQFIFESQN